MIYTLDRAHPLAHGLAFGTVLDHDLWDFARNIKGSLLGSTATRVGTPFGDGYDIAGGSGGAYFQWPDSPSLTVTREEMTIAVLARLDAPTSGNASMIGHNAGAGVSAKWMFYHGPGSGGGVTNATVVHINMGGAGSYAQSSPTWSPVAGRYYLISASYRWFGTVNGDWYFYVDGRPNGDPITTGRFTPPINPNAPIQVGWYNEDTKFDGAIVMARFYPVYKPPAWHALLWRDPFADLRTRVRLARPVLVSGVETLVSKNASDSLAVSLSETESAVIFATKAASDSISVKLTDVADTPVVVASKSASDSISAKVSEATSLGVEAAKSASDSVAPKLSESGALTGLTFDATDTFAVTLAAESGSIVTAEVKTDADTFALGFADVVDVAVSTVSVLHEFSVTEPQIDKLVHTFTVVSNRQVSQLLHVFSVREQWGLRKFAHTFHVIAAGRVTPVLPYLVTSVPVADANLVFQSVAGGLVVVEYVALETAGALSVGVVGNKITVTLATDASGTVLSTASQVAAAITASGPASALVTAALAPDNDGTGVVMVTPPRTLSGVPLIVRDILRPVTN